MSFLFLASITVLQQITVDFQLDLTQSYIDVDFLFARQAFLNFCLGPAQHERT